MSEYERIRIFETTVDGESESLRQTVSECIKSKFAYHGGKKDMHELG